MPKYLYNCSKCGEFTHVHGMTEKLEKCPECNSNIKKLVTSTNNFILKGSGFYCNDYGKKDSVVTEDQKISRKKDAIANLKNNISKKKLK